MNGYIWGIVVYCIIIVCIGLLATKKVQGAFDFFVAGRNFGPGLLFTSLIAANIGAGSTIGVTGLGYTYGISSWWWIGTSALGSLVLAYTVGPKIWAMARDYNLYTLGDYVETRYNRAFRIAMALMMALGTLALFAGQLIGIAWVLTTVAGTSKIAGIIIGAVVIGLYVAAGGLLSSTIVNLFQIAVIFLGFIVTVPFALHFVGGWSGMEQMISRNLADNTKVSGYYSFFGIGTKTILGYLFMLTPSFIISPGLIQKIYGARDRSAVIKGTAINGIIQLLFAFIPAVLGMAAFAAFPGLTTGELALPTVMKEMLPVGIGAVALAAVFAAEASTADAVLFMLASSFTKDVYATVIKPGLGEKDLLQVSRVTALCGALLGIGMALYLPSIISALSIFYTLMSVALTAPIVFGLYSRQSRSGAALASAILGIAVTMIIRSMTNGKGYWLFTPQAIGMVVSIVVMAIPVCLAKKPQVNP